MGDWLSGIGDWAANTWGGVSQGASDLWSDIGDVFSDDDLEQAAEIDTGAGLDWSVFNQLPTSPSSFLPGMNGDDYGGGMVQTSGALSGALATGGIWLGSLLARTMGGMGRGVVMRAENGVRVRMAQLWPLVRKYGAEAVAGGLGVSLGALGTLLSRPEALSGRGKKGRGRGISARDVKTTRRTLRAVKRIYNQMPKRAHSWSGGGGGGRTYYRRRYR